MATPRDLMLYDEALPALFTRALKGAISMDFGTAKAARAARGRIYSFRQALANAEGYVEGYEVIMLMAPIARMRIEGSTLTLAYEEITDANTCEPAHDPT